MAVASFLYKALDAQGQQVVGTLDANDEKTAFDLLVQRGLSPFEIKQRQQSGQGFSFGTRAVRKRDLARYVRQLATLLNAGVTLLETIETLSQSSAHPVLADRTREIKGDLRAGRKLSDALESHIPELPDYVVKLAELGELTGSLPKALTDAADRLDYEETLQSEMRSALSYPAFLASVGGLIVLLMFLFVVPRFATLLGDRIENAPWLSQVVISSGVWLRENWILAAMGVAAIVGLSLVIWRNENLRSGFRTQLEKMPVVGGFLTQAEIGSWSRTVGVALENKAPLIDALRLGEDGTRSPRFARNLSLVRRAVRAGRPLDEALYEAQQDIEPVLIDLIRTGRNAGALGEMMTFAADIFEKEARERAKKLTALTEPFAILMISLVVGTIVISIVMAMTSLYDINVGG
ncbi:MAG: type II secretion system F family protein [Pseudomonadota bacterium]